MMVTTLYSQSCYSAFAVTSSDVAFAVYHYDWVWKMIACLLDVFVPAVYCFLVLLYHHHHVFVQWYLCGERMKQVAML